MINKEKLRFYLKEKRLALIDEREAYKNYCGEGQIDFKAFGYACFGGKTEIETLLTKLDAGEFDEEMSKNE